MNRNVRHVLLSCLIAMPLVAQASQADEAADQTVADLQAAALEDHTAWNLLESLTTEVGPRMAGTPGDARAVAWAENKLKELRADRVWKEPVTFPRWRRVSESARIMDPRSQPLAVTALGGSPATGGPISAEVVSFADLDALTAADPESIRGKIAFITKRMKRTREGSGYGETVTGRSKGPFVAAGKGALALVIRSVGTDNNRLAHTGMMSTSTQGPRVPSAAISNPDADVLEGLLRRGPVTLELDLECGFDGKATSYNVIGEFSGQSDEFVAVGGHLDSWDLGTGAIDDGVGVAITMAAAKLAAGVLKDARRGVRVVLFANEEQGVYGGKTYAADHADELEAHVLGAESDLGSGRVFQFRTRVNPSAQPYVAVLASWLEPLGIPFSGDRPAYGGADFGSMRELGMPVVDLNHDATRYFDLHHTPNDTLDKVDPSDLRFNVAAYATLIYWAAAKDTVFGPVPPAP
jgi:carboxypeptidase Q